MVITTRQKHQLEHLRLNINVNSEKLCQVESHKLLGVVIDNCLQWKQHIEKVCNKVSKNLYLLSKLKLYVNSSYRMKFFYAHCLSHINYSSTVWSGAANIHLIKLNSLHRRGAKLISSSINSDTSKKLKDLNILPLKAQLDYNIATLVFKCKHDKAPYYLQSLLLKSSDRYCSLRYLKPKCNNDIFQTSFCMKGASIWNDLTIILKEKKSFAGFKTLLKKCLIEQSNAYLLF